MRAKQKEHRMGLWDGTNLLLLLQGLLSGKLRQVVLCELLMDGMSRSAKCAEKLFGGKIAVVVYSHTECLYNVFA